MKFSYKTFSCDVDVFTKDKDIVVKFYDNSLEHKAEEIINLVIVDPGFGYISLKYKGEDALIGGFLDGNVFVEDEMIHHPVDFVANLSPGSENAYMPYHIRRVKSMGYVEYNGEY